MSENELIAPGGAPDAPGDLGDPDFSDAVVRALYRYPRKHYPLALRLAIGGGILGVHRAYLGFMGSAMAMFLSAVGGGIWWLYDLFTVRRLVGAANAEQARREEAGLPPRALSFLPPIAEQGALTRPKWAHKRSGSLRLYASALLLLLLGLCQGVISSATGVHEPVVTVVVFLFASLVVARWSWLQRVPALGALSLWAHRLRLFYFHVDPGPVWLLASRPIFGVLVAPFRAKVRAEVQLHLQLGFVLSALLLLFDLREMFAAGSIGAAIGGLFMEFLQTLVLTYLFVAPIGALITTQILVERSDRAVWVLALLTLTGVGLGAMIAA